CLQYYSKPFTF
nr:immunoglobulin light chain junction region [Macaca mulatta]MOV36915.1 immunoglobulin light chain junction region [Macaca mulatta]MOV36969.1 immunoglobulin light chain junction region [Macaca mulatta]MOV36977.1 immunoglobulin light chain junction region [Macaca mulatta]MOV36988.1 immunoglobulin light chain junction region [Macaca mulatta]